MIARLLTLVAVAVSLVAFIAGQTAHTNGGGTLSHVSFVLLVLAISVALLSGRCPSLLGVGAQTLAAAAALGFTAVALAKYYESGAPPYGLASAFAWVDEAEVLALAALAFGLTLARRRSAVGIGALAAAVGVCVGGALYALTLNGGFAASVWWAVAGIGAFLAASVAAGLERGGSLALGASVAGGPGGGSRSDSGFE